MFAMPMKKINERIKDIAARSHNLPEDEKNAAIEKVLEDNWNEVMGKAENYVQGQHILDNGGHFSTMSLGNWEVLCTEAGVETVPARLGAVVNPVFLFDVYTNGIKDGSMDEMKQFLGGFQHIEEDEVVRFDACASTSMKTELTLGRASGEIPEDCGYTNRSGTNFPDFNDERIISELMANPENKSPVWIRQWIEPVMMEGDATAGYKASLLPEQMNLPEGQSLPEGEGNLFPCEWRAFIMYGEVVAVGNYYPQIARGKTPEDEAIALTMVAEVKAAAQRLIEKLKEVGGIPHHPRYEHRDDFDPDACHFSLDFLEAADESAPNGRRLVMLEGGPPHLRDPHWGAHPVSFGTSKAPSGIALSVNDIRPRADLDALAIPDHLAPAPQP